MITDSASGIGIDTSAWENTYQIEPEYISTKLNRQIAHIIPLSPSCFREPIDIRRSTLMYGIRQTHLCPYESQDNGRNDDLPGKTCGTFNYSLAAISCQVPVFHPIFPEPWPVQDTKLRICFGQRSGALHAPRLLWNGWPYTCAKEKVSPTSRAAKNFGENRHCCLSSCLDRPGGDLCQPSFQETSSPDISLTPYRLNIDVNPYFLVF